jgi:hypothetical protein
LGKKGAHLVVVHETPLVLALSPTVRLEERLVLGIGRG